MADLSYLYIKNCMTMDHEGQVKVLIDFPKRKNSISAKPIKIPPEDLLAKENIIAIDNWEDYDHIFTISHTREGRDITYGMWGVERHKTEAGEIYGTFHHYPRIDVFLENGQDEFLTFESELAREFYCDRVSRIMVHKGIDYVKEEGVVFAGTQIFRDGKPRTNSQMVYPTVMNVARELAARESKPLYDRINDIIEFVPSFSEESIYRKIRLEQPDPCPF